MKKLLIILIALIVSNLNAETFSSVNSLKTILQTPEILSYFEGVFESLGVEIEETGEKFTIYHTGEKFVFQEGVNEESVDFVVPLKLENIQNMVSHTKDGVIDASESWRILDVLFTPLTKVTLESPVLSVNWRKE